MIDEVETAAADVAAAEATLAAAEAQQTTDTQHAAVLADNVDAEKADRPAGTAHVVTAEVQTRYLDDRAGAQVE
jgi:hypothetical protein